MPPHTSWLRLWPLPLVGLLTCSSLPCPAVLYCTLLAKTESESARRALEEEMLQDPRKRAVLEELSEIRSENLVQEEKTRKAQARRSRMGAELDAEDAELAEKKGVCLRVCVRVCCCATCVVV